MGPYALPGRPGSPDYLPSHATHGTIVSVADGDASGSTASVPGLAGGPCGPGHRPSSVELALCAVGAVQEPV